MEYRGVGGYVLARRGVYDDIKQVGKSARLISIQAPFSSGEEVLQGSIHIVKIIG